VKAVRGLYGVASELLCTPSMGAMQKGCKSPVGGPARENVKELVREANSARVTERGKEG